MKFKILLLIGMILFSLSSCIQEDTEAPQVGVVSFTGLNINTFNNNLGNSNSKLSDESQWKHILPLKLIITITNKFSGHEYEMILNPKYFLNSYQITLPYGEYSIEGEVTGNNVSNYLPFKIWGEFELKSNATDIILEGTTDYGLVTISDEYLKEAKLSEGKFSYSNESYYAYIKEGMQITIEIIEFFNNISFQKTINISRKNHYHFFLQIKETEEGQINFIELAIGPFTLISEGIEIEGESVTDASGNSYPIVKIGEQWWLAENLRSTKYCNGDTIFNPNHTYIMPYTNNNIPVMYLQKAFQSPKVTGYYTDDAILDPRNICPCDWHISTDEDWIELELYLGLPEEDIYKVTRGVDQMVGSKLKHTEIPNVDRDLGDATNESGFSAYYYSWFSGAEEEGGIPEQTYFYIDTYDDAHWYSPSKEKPLLGRTIKAFHTGISRFTLLDGNLYTARCVKD